MSQFVPSSVNIPLFWPKFEFSMFLIGQVLSVPCYFFLFYHILFDRTARKSVQNHSIVILLLYNFLNVTIDLSLTQNYTRLGYVSLFNPFVCLVWQFIDFGIWYGGISLMLWISIERHLFIFYPNRMRPSRHRLLFHYIPLLITALYAPTLFFVLIFIIPCNRVYLQEKSQCGSPCFYNVVPNWFSLYDSFVDYAIPILLIVLFNIGLFVRFLKQKQRLKRTVTWRQCRKMLIQLFLVSITYVVFDLPYVIIFTVRLVGFSTFGNSILSPYIMRLTYVPAIVVPFAILLGLSGLRQKLNALCFWKRNIRMIRPINI